MTTTIGIDVGSGVIKTVLFQTEGDDHRWLARRDLRIRQNDRFELIAESVAAVLAETGLDREAVDYIATTGEGENVRDATGHFYSMTTHARGAIYLNPEARAVLDIGALNGRAIRIDAQGKVLNYRMTSQCASGSGQFLENISRYLGISQDEIGELSQQSTNPEKVSGICAVLAETDVINMVSRSIPPSDILRGIHESMAGRLIKLLKAIGVVQGVVMMTGGLGLDSGLVKAMQDGMDEQKMATRIATHPDSLYAGAIGAAIWGAFRYRKLKEKGQLPKAS
ncbi:benzoyl-CoA reductase subunit D [Geothermobacter hydrogeniphilus]|uniref:Benzoyl-CoA reductase subunit D n=1 Tax=Geothermobacter hydrogeniphilus TaxID=1969733 RepID=A0A1X0Y2G6_9BACT|nr:benzoyl-CoA reductase subunit D [Geothermobacter hydrogeniphilus]ORJ59284.1 benzoyl-CoA reductase subunit D [Geothermobacter hydrogeniphilus]